VLWPICFGQLIPLCWLACWNRPTSIDCLAFSASAKACLFVVVMGYFILRNKNDDFDWTNRLDSLDSTRFDPSTRHRLKNSATSEPLSTKYSNRAIFGSPTSHRAEPSSSLAHAQSQGRESEARRRPHLRAAAMLAFFIIIIWPAISLLPLTERTCGTAATLSLSFVAGD